MSIVQNILARARGLVRSGPLAPAGGAGSGGWFPIVREPFPGAWQQNQELTPDSALASCAVYACVSLIASDIGKLTLRLMALDAPGIWTETTNPAYSPVLREPNRYQLTGPFVEQWITSKLVHGNAYILKQRDQRGVVSALYVLDPTRVAPLVTPDGAVYYQLDRSELAGLTDTTPIVAPAREIIHDPMICLFHPLIGVSPLYACGLSALQGQTIQQQSNRFFGNGANPGGVLTAPGQITQAQADELKKQWEAYVGGVNQGRVAILDRGLEYKPLAMSAVDAQLIDQLKWTTEQICSAFHVPPVMIGGPFPPYGSVTPIVQQYYAQCLQALIAKFERSLAYGLELGPNLATKFTLEDLLLLDTETRTKAAHDTIAGGVLSPNEARQRYFGIGPVDGGDSPFMQQQYYSLEALASRDLAPPSPPMPPVPPPPSAPDEVLATLTAIRTAALREGLYAA